MNKGARVTRYGSHIGESLLLALKAEVEILR